MSQAEISVFECNDLRNLIFSYLRKYPEKECFYCGDVLIWDRKRVKQFIQMSWVPEIPTENFCLDCWRNHSYMGPPCSIS